MSARPTLDQRIRGDIEGRIRSGEWRPGFRIPYEHELVAEYGCARATVSKALEALMRAGLIERRRKAGSFVAHPHVQTPVLDIPDIGSVIAARGDSYRYELRERRIRKAHASDEDEALLGARGSVLALVGVHFAAGEPFGCEARVINLDVVPEARHVDFTSLAPGSWLLGHVPWSDARHRISAVAADTLVADALAVSEGDACLQIERWTWRMGAGVTFVRQTYPGDRYDLVADFSPQPR